MVTFIIGLVILFAGGAIYGKFCERIFGPDDRDTPAYAMRDGVDYVPIKKWKNSLIDLLSIAGTGPILGPIQGILFGPIAFITIPLGCVLGGAVHDYFSGMVSMREGGKQMPELISKYNSKPISTAYKLVFYILLITATTVFTYTPGDLATNQLLDIDAAAANKVVWIAYGIILGYYFLASILPIHKVIGRYYPIMAALMIVTTVGILIGVFAKAYPLTELWDDWNSGLYIRYGDYFGENHFIPIFFITVVCGIISGVHSTQTTLISRTVESEKDGRRVFYDMMIMEGLIAMIWSAGAMGVYNLGLQSPDPSLASSTIGVICKDIFGPFFGRLAMIGIIVLPITSGDTMLRALRLAISEKLNISAENKKMRLLISSILVAIILGVLILAKSSPSGFSLIWRYNSWLNQIMILFTVACICRWMSSHGKKKHIWIILIPATFYAFVTSSFILSAKIGFGLNWTLTYILAGAFSVVYLLIVAKTPDKEEMI